MTLLDRLIEGGWVPEPVLRRGIRHLIRARLRKERGRGERTLEARVQGFLARTRRNRIAERPEAANLQHYEVPSSFFERVLGPYMKYSCYWFQEANASLEQAEEAMLALTAERAELANGQAILDLGCGWGSLSLWAAQRFPRSRIVAVSNSTSQGDWIRKRAQELGITNVEHRRVDINDWQPCEQFDRIVSVEMLEHVRDHSLLFSRLGRCLAPGGKLWVHVFCHRELAYSFENEGVGDWMARHFFTGGVMPSSDLLPELARGTFREEERCWIPGTHYSRTAEGWLARLKAHRKELEARLAWPQDPESGVRAWRRWRIFFLACAELFGYRNGTEWGVVHHRFVRVENGPLS